ncbi:family 20 glycosylhydrolase [Thalassotalea atypica]|uniref:family 20 glycosylhydrolase n=1 Tax=Thalassotalea atypica TaxID=2054316 RepID=UPI002574816F|nr:family 20 glycosylhydrolase [Thalassotalea atypica]
MRFFAAGLFLIVNTALIGCQPAEEHEVATDKNPATALANGEHANQSNLNVKLATQQDIDLLANALDVTYRLITNIPDEKCDKTKADGACFTVELSFTATEEVIVDDWFVYFSQISPIQSSESDWFNVKHINGDLHLISLKEGFNGFKQGETKHLTFRANYWSLSETDALPNYIVASESTEARVIESTKAKIDVETGLEILPYVAPYTDVAKHFKRKATDNTQWLTPEALFERNLAVQAPQADAVNQIIPTPKSITFNPARARLDLATGINITSENIKLERVSVAISRLEKLGISRSTQGRELNLKVNKDDTKKMGSYQLNVLKDKITITGVDDNGVFNGLQSLASLISIGQTSVPLVTIKDEPHYEFRGMLVDVARNFRSKEFMLRLLDQMAAYKLNKLHLHLGDDEGWRLEIPSLPELTELSSKRCFDPSETTCLMPQLGAGVDHESRVNGYFSVAEYQELLKAASARFIQVIPSLDMPGHSRAAVKAMNARYEKYMAKEQEDKAVEFLLHDMQDKTEYSSVQYYNDNTINVCMESSYAFVKQVMLDVKAIHEQAGQPLTRYHIGADETAGAWVNSPKCQEFLAKHNAEISSAKELGAYFVERTANILAELDIEAAAWIDGLEHTNVKNMPAVIQANAWHPLASGGHKSSHKIANYNWQVVVSSPDVTYFDFPYEADPKEHGYYWAARRSNTEKLFQFMPDNLPVHAEFWLDREDNPYVADDRLTKDDEGKITSSPLQPGVRFYGVQGQLWSENTRTDATAEHKIFPRLFSLAERGWHQANWAVPYKYQGFEYSQQSNTFTDTLKATRDNAWQLFAHTIGTKELAKLELDNVQYRLPTVGAKIISGKLNANIAFPGLPIEYKTQGAQWQSYRQPVDVSGEVLVRSRSLDGKRAGRPTRVSAQ